MKIYEINEKIEKLIESSIDFETGEIVNENFDIELQKIEEQKEKKLLDLACYANSIKSEIEVAKEYVDRIKNKIHAMENKQNFIREIIRQNLPEGEKLKDLRVSVYWMNTNSVNVTIEPKDLPVEYQKITIEAKKTDIKKAIESGLTVDGCEIVKNTSLVVRG